MTTGPAATLSDRAIVIAKDYLAVASASGESSFRHRVNEDDIEVQVDWGAIRDAIANAPSLERAVGRAVVLATTSSGHRIHPKSRGVMPLDPSLVDPFFAFSVADVVPDFGDDLTRTRFGQRFTRILRRDGRPSNSGDAQAPSARAGA
jgi:hypothetical protein